MAISKTRNAVELVLADLRRRGYQTKLVRRLPARGRFSRQDHEWQDWGTITVPKYASPDERAPDRPLIYRFTLEMVRWRSGAASQPAMAVSAHRREIGFELSVLPKELVAFATWLPSWIDSRLRAADVDPEPLPIVWWPAHNYAWSKAALTKYDDWSRKHVGVGIRRVGQATP